MASNLPIAFNGGQMKTASRDRLAARVGTAGFEFNSPYAGPLFYPHLGAPLDRIGSYRLLWAGKLYGKQARA